MVTATFVWGFVVIGGPLLLLLAALWARSRTAKRNDRIDPETHGDDPSKGMEGHDRPNSSRP